MTRSARPYLDSLMAIREDMGVSFEEVQDWNCCGATEYASVHRLGAHALVARNLALAEQQVNGTHTLAAGCSACYLNLAKTDRYMREDEKLRGEVNEALAAGGLAYNPGAVEVRHLLDIVYNDVGLDAIRRRVVKPLKGLRIAPYYGCMIVRPDPDNRFGNPEYPQALDQLMDVLGAKVIDFPMKAHCCSGHMTQISPPVAYELIRRLIHAADQYRADLMVTLCPMCQLNLDAFQADMNRHFGTSYHVPVLYFTQLMGLAFGYEAEELGIGKEFVSARAALAKIGIEVPEEEPPARPKPRAKDDPSLPMPSMPVDEEDAE
jgi:heterodisulfide reductase subunit B